MPEVAKAVVLLAILTAVLGMGVSVISAEYQHTPTHVETVDNETLTQDIGNWTAVDAASEPGVTGFYDNETVENESGDQLVENTDYEWASNGSVKFYDTQNTSDGANASITYSYDSRPQQAATMMGPIAVMFEISGVFPLVVVAGAAFLAIGHLRNVSLGRGGGGGRR
jgi:hypothetical protein